MNADGSKPTPLTDQQGEEANWSPDGTKIAFASTRDGDNEAPNPVDWNEELYVVEADCSDVTRLTKIPGNDLWPPPGRQTGRRLAHAKAQFRRPRSYFRTPHSEFAATGPGHRPLLRPVRDRCIGVRTRVFRKAGGSSIPQSA